MNIQEGIKELESHKMKSEDIRADYYNDGINAGIAVMKKLDEPQKKIIPKCAHKFIQEGIDSGSDYFTIIICADSFANAKPQDEFSKWLRKNSGLFIRALLNGYEIEKEPLYRVKLGEGYFVEYHGRGAPIMIIPDDNKEIKIFDSKSDAERTAQAIGGTVEEVVEG